MNLAMYIGLVKKTVSVARELRFGLLRWWNLVQMASCAMPMRMHKEEFHHHFPFNLRQLTLVKTGILYKRCYKFFHSLFFYTRQFFHFLFVENVSNSVSCRKIIRHMIVLQHTCLVWQCFTFISMSVNNYGYMFYTICFTRNTTFK